MEPAGVERIVDALFFGDGEDFAEANSAEANESRLFCADAGGGSDWEYPGVHVMSGGEMTFVSIQTAGVPTYVAMEPMIVAHTEQYIVGTMTPTPNPEIVASSPLTFRAPIAAAQNATVREANYGNGTTNPPQVYTLNNGCNGFAVVNPGNPVVPVTSGSGAATLTIVPVVTPMPNGASCSVAVTDNTPQTQNIGIAVGPTYPLLAAGGTDDCRAYRAIYRHEASNRLATHDCYDHGRFAPETRSKKAPGCDFGQSDDLVVVQLSYANRSFTGRICAGLYNADPPLSNCPRNRVNPKS